MTQAPALAAVVVMGVLVCSSCTGHEDKRPSVLLVTLDTVRADHLGCYGYPVDTTPTIDRLSREGVRCAAAVAQAPETNASHATIMTSLYPYEHRAANAIPLHATHATLAEVLRGHGYPTAAFVSGWPLVARASGLDRGFEVYDDVMEIAVDEDEEVERRADRTIDRALGWLGTLRDEPFMLWVHLYDPHAPYAPPAPFDTLTSAHPAAPVPAVVPPDELPSEAVTDSLRAFLSAYDGEIAFADHHLGRLLEALSPRKSQNPLLIVVTSDHGESFGEHGYYFDHLAQIYEPLVRVPLVFWAPGLLPRGVVFEELVELADVAPTVCSVLGIPWTGGRGRDLTSWFTRPAPSEGRAYTQVCCPWYPPAYALRAGSLKVILKPQSDPELEVYDLAIDPWETLNLFHEGTDSLATELARSLRWIASSVEPLDQVSPENKDRLRSLGYVP